MAEALRAGIPLDAVVASPRLPAVPGGADLAEALSNAGVEPIVADDEAVRSVQDARSPQPVVAIARHRPPWHPAPAEVARVVEAPLSAFLPGAPIVEVHEEVRGWPLRYGAYPIEDLLVWGATARILGQLGALLQPPGE